MSVVFLVPVIVLSVKQGKSIQRKDESLYQRLVRVCNPKLLMKDYNKEKMSKAITLYNELVNTKPDDYDALCNIEASAINELGVSLINSNELEELKKRVNPVNFFNPYNSRKAAMANELYSILLKPDLTYKEFMDVKEKSDDLYK